MSPVIRRGRVVFPNTKDKDTTKMKAWDNSQRSNPSPPTTRKDEEDEGNLTITEKRDTPMLIRGVVLGASDKEIVPSVLPPNTRETERKSEGDSQAINPSSPATLDKTSPQKRDLMNTPLNMPRPPDGFLSALLGELSNVVGDPLVVVNSHTAFDDAIQKRENYRYAQCLAWTFWDGGNCCG
ncbi:hypothetical protein SBOR_1851 [Sclerotinia borealis F-4128]|uniref:Uncharacterized protein n=1 Tax=Sclerotinia borealis (strain F-4128) TaxID=1432307 RepID=W9CT55_SCLBF|nr:hypothetical protein SBOR_1851 [Sclerotinia borealis F-4128]